MENSFNIPYNAKLYVKDKENVSCFLFKQYMQYYYNNFDSIIKDRENYKKLSQILSEKCYK